MKKVLLVTIFDRNNFGNRLQHFALQKVLESYGVEVTSLNNCPTKLIERIKDRAQYLAKLVLISLGKHRYIKNNRRYLIQTSNHRFNKKNLTHIKETSNQKAFHTDWSYYDLAIAGSDQIWHKWSKDDQNELPYYYLQFMPPEKRFAYAASFGFEEFPEQDLEQHRIGLQGMKEISCREELGCKLIEDLTGRTVPRVLDPTLLLSADEWRNFAKKSNGIAKKQGKYAFAFFLGSTSEEYKDRIAKVMKEKGIDKLINFRNEKIRACGPYEFLNLIDNAQYIFTDSFHCTVFSTLFDKDFTVFRRVQPGHEKMFGRIEDLLSCTGKLDRIYGETTLEAKNDFDQLRKDSIRYIETILGIENEN